MEHIRVYARAWATVNEAFQAIESPDLDLVASPRPSPEALGRATLIKTIQRTARADG